MRTVVDKKEETPFKSKVEEIFRKNHHLLYRAAYGVLESREDSEDVIHDVFTKILRAGPSIELIRNPAGYLKRAVVRAAFNCVRSRQNQKLMDVDVFDLETLLLASGPATDNHRTQSLRVALSQLDPVSHAILILRFDLGYSCSEIGEIFGLSRGAIKEKIRRTVRELRKLMSTETPPAKRDLNQLISTPGEAQ